MTRSPNELPYVRARAGFTLIELMIVVSILGVLAAVAIPSFIAYVRRSKTVEAHEVLGALYVRAATYHAREFFDSGLTGAHNASCTVPNADNRVAPAPGKTVGDYRDPGVAALGFQQAPSYFRYELVNEFAASGACAVPTSTSVYTLRARGDLDSDATLSLFELAVATDANNVLYRSQIAVVDELE